MMRRLAVVAIALTFLVPGTVLGQAADAEPLPEPGTSLEPGRYVSSAVGPTIDFRVDEGWVVGPDDGGPIFTLLRGDQPGTILSVTRFDGEAFVDSCDPTSLTSVEASVPRFIEIIAGDGIIPGNPYLNTGPPATTDVDGFPGIWLDVATPAYAECDLPYLLIWALPIEGGGEFVQVADQQSRFIVVDVDGDVIVIAIESFPGVPFGGLLEASLDLVDSMRIEPGEYVAPEPAETPGTEEPEPSPEAEAPPQPEASPTSLDGGADASA